MDLSPKEIDKAKFVFSIYDFEGIDKIDAYNLGDALRALDLTPTLKTIAKLGGLRIQGEGYLSLEEFLAVYAEAKKDKNVGCLADYVELLKCYDKYNDGTMSAGQLNQILLSKGEKMDNQLVQGLLDECCEEPDEEGHIPYVPFITKICQGPPSAFDQVDLSALSGAGNSNSNSQNHHLQEPSPRKLRPSITIDDEDVPSVSFAAAIPLSRKGSRASLSSMDNIQPEERPEASFTLKTPRKSITPVDA